jgi:hypothetical protein
MQSYTRLPQYSPPLPTTICVGVGWGRHGSRPPQASAAPAPPGRALEGHPGPQSAKNGRFPTFSKVASAANCAICAHNARQPPLWGNVGFEPFSAVLTRLLVLWGSIGPGGKLLVHFCRHRVAGTKVRFRTRGRGAYSYRCRKGKKISPTPCRRCGQV